LWLMSSVSSICRKTSSLPNSWAATFAPSLNPGTRWVCMPRNLPTPRAEGLLEMTARSGTFVISLLMSTATLPSPPPQGRRVMPPVLSCTPLAKSSKSPRSAPSSLAWPGGLGRSRMSSPLTVSTPFPP